MKVEHHSQGQLTHRVWANIFFPGNLRTLTVTVPVNTLNEALVVIGALIKIQSHLDGSMETREPSLELFQQSGLEKLQENGEWDEWYDAEGKDITPYFESFVIEKRYFIGGFEDYEN